MMMLILTYVPSVLCGIHVLRTGREMFWLWLFIIGPMIAPAFYFFAVLLPEMLGGRTARGVGKAAQRALNPQREYRQAMAALEDTQTVGNRMKVEPLDVGRRTLPCPGARCVVAARVHG